MAAQDSAPQSLLDAARQGDRRALARLISAAERGESLPPLPLISTDREQALCVGITGAPGAGKSTLVSALTKALLEDEASAAVLAVDPSSPLSRGALLGDRVRMHQHATAPNVFIRSMATRSHHGGLARATQAARRLLQDCGWPLVILETVGVGQVELEVVNTADLIVVVLNPGWGDEIQANKAGLMEIADVFVINKADRPGLENTRRDLEAVLINRPAERRPPIIETIAVEGEGIVELAAAIQRVRRELLASGQMATRRRLQLHKEFDQQLEREFARALAGARSTEQFHQQLQQLEDGAVTVEAAAQLVLAQALPGPAISKTQESAP